MPKPKTMICLISDQRMQNVIPLFQNGWEFKKVLMIGSSFSEKSAIRLYADKYKKIFGEIKDGVNADKEIEFELYSL